MFEGNEKYNTDGFRTFDSRAYLRSKLKRKMKKYRLIKHEGIESIRNLSAKGKNKFILEQENVHENYGT